MLLGRWVLPAAVSLLLAFGLAAAPATGAAATSLTLTASQGYAGSPTHLRVRLAGSGTPFAGEVVIERRVDGSWAEVARVTTDAEGTAVVDALLSKRKEANVFRARFAGDGTHPAAASAPRQAHLLRRDSVVESLVGRNTS